MQQVTAPKSEGLGFKGMPPVKGFHLTNGWLPDAVKRLSSACEGVVWSLCDLMAMRSLTHTAAAGLSPSARRAS